MSLRYLLIISVISLLLLPLSSSPLQITGVLEPENDDEARLNRLLPSDQIMDAVGITQGMVVAEIGAGRGRFLVQLAVRVGETGKVYAEDIDASALRYLENRCEKWGLLNVETIQGDVTDPKLPIGELDLIFVVSSYHHFKDPMALLQKAKSALKPNGRLAIAEWLPWNEDDREGTSGKDLVTQMESAGYELIRTEKLEVDKPLNIYIFRRYPMAISKPRFLGPLSFR